MFGLGIGKHKKKLEQALSACFDPLKDELGNVPLPMQTDPAINASILAVCERYAHSQDVTKPSHIASIVDAVFEELYRSESINVQDRLDSWKNDHNEAFAKAYDAAQSKANSELELTWLSDFAKANFEPATGLML